ncbi:helix-turn-helix domain-containing protein [Dactylosporangium sp. CA-139066]|uniref:helix-turn-helix domain-containing protein n=1 Tax=Dactylosporangium sp. CA-139066 TaxID=3239930 RepID=UPI003D8B9C74
MLDGGNTFAEALRAARHAAGLTLEDLAEAAGVSVRALSDMERGRALSPQRRTVALIADALKLEDAQRDHFVTLARSGRTRAASLTAANGLCELPGSIGDFTGRAAELTWIFRAVGTLDHAGSRAAVISGGAGLGKTTLVVRAVQGLRDRFPDGVHFVDALGMSGRPVTSDEMLARVLRALGVRDQQLPQDPSERSARYRQLLRERTVLVIVDDAASESQVRPLIPGEGRSHLLVTSRRLLAGLEGVRRLHLDPMPPVDAYDLIGRIVAERAESPDARELQGLADLLGGLPLALRIAGNRLVSRPQWSVADLVARLSDTARRLDQLSAGDLKVAATFEMSYEQLPARTRHLFRAASMVPGADFGAALAGVLGDIPVTSAEDELDDLVDLSLLETAQGGRYRFHDLVRLYASQRLEQEDPAEAVAEARNRMVGWLVQTLTAAGQWFEPGGVVTAFDSREDAEAWIRVESEHWFSALCTAALSGKHCEVVHAVSAMHWFSDRWIDWSTWRDVFLLGYESAVELGEGGRQAEFLNYVAWTYSLPGRDPARTLEYAQRALSVARTVGDRMQEAWALQYAAIAHSHLDDLAAAMVAAGTAAEMFEQAGDIDAVCQTWTVRGHIARRLGDPVEALANYRRAQQLVEDPASGMTPAIAELTLPNVVGCIGDMLGLIGRADEAIPLLQRAADLYARMQFHLGHANVLLKLAELYDDSHAAEAKDCLRRAAEIYESLDQPANLALCRERLAAMQ